VIKAICGSIASPRGEAWETLTPAEIAARCRARAETAIARAEDARDFDVSHLEAAEAWMQLADDIEWAAEKAAPHRPLRVIAARQLGKVT
jgi:hypothetical protein